MDDLDQRYRSWDTDRSDAAMAALLESVRRFALQRLRDEDAAQTVVIFVWRGLERFAARHAAAFSRWTSAVTKNARRSLLLDQLRHPHIAVPEDLDCSWEIDDDRFLDLSRLDPERRWVAEGILRGESLHEIALALGIQPATLRQRLRRWRPAAIPV